MEELNQPQGEFHHFQLVNAEGDVPVSISVLVHYNQKTQRTLSPTEPISTEDVIAFHEALQQFDGDYRTAFQKQH